MVILSWVNLTTGNTGEGLFKSTSHRHGVSLKEMVKRRFNVQAGRPLKEDTRVISKDLWQWEYSE